MQYQATGHFSSENGFGRDPGEEKSDGRATTLNLKAEYMELEQPQNKFI